MKEPRKTAWTAAALLVVATIGMGCGGPPAPEPAAVAEPPSAEMLERGAAFYEEWGCGLCHGEQREGGELAPPLPALGQRWTEDAMTEYLLDPAAARDGNARLGELDQRYPDAEMPGFDFPEEDRRALAAWLLHTAPDSP